MILFLDTISPLPEFSIIEDNKIIYSKRIINNNSSKFSDSLIPLYMKINKEFNLRENLHFLIIKEKDMLSLNTKPHYYEIDKFDIEFPYKAEGC